MQGSETRVAESLLSYSMSNAHKADGSPPRTSYWNSTGESRESREGVDSRDTDLCVYVYAHVCGRDVCMHTCICVYTSAHEAAV